MNVNRVNYLFSEKEFDTTRDLYRAVLVAACKSASQKAKGYDESLTHFTNAFDLDELMVHMPMVESVTGQLKTKYSLVSTLAAICVLDKAGYIDADRTLEAIQLESHLFKMIADAWAVAMGVTRHEILRDEPIYAKDFQRAVLIDAVRDRRAESKGVCMFDRKAVAAMRKGEVIAA